MSTNLKLRPVYYASVSGGDDSFYMLNVILNNPDKYPLDMVVHFDLEIDWGWSKRVIDFMEERCLKAGLRFVRIKPTKTWAELYEKYGFPTAHAKWCNLEYKLDCKKQLEAWIRSQNCRPVAYIGLCADEAQRFKYTIGETEDQDQIYPLAEEGICEAEVNMWARNQPIFEGYYRHFDRQGCKLCPFLSMKEMAYLKKNEPETFEYMFNCIKETEDMILKKKGKVWKYRGVGADVIKKRVETKWTSILNMEENQLHIFDFIDEV